MVELPNDIVLKLRTLVAEVLERAPEELTDDADFFDAYGADSLQGIEIVSQIEVDLGVVIPQDALRDMTTMGRVYDLVLCLLDTEYAT